MQPIEGRGRLDSLAALLRRLEDLDLRARLLGHRGPVAFLERLGPLLVGLERLVEVRPVDAPLLERLVDVDDPLRIRRLGDEIRADLIDDE